MDAEDIAVARIAAAIGEPARARMLFSLLDNHARTSTELATLAGITPATASTHLNRLKSERLIQVQAQGKHRYYRLAGLKVAQVLEGLSILAGSARPQFVPSTPPRLRFARTCYDHLAGTLGVAIHDHLLAAGWLQASSKGNEYSLTATGSAALTRLGINDSSIAPQRRKFAFACLDWSERRHHLGGTLGSALLKLTLDQRWIHRDLNSRAVSLTSRGRQELARRFGISV